MTTPIITFAAYAANPADYVRGRVHEYALQQYAQLQKQLSDLPDRVQQMRTELSARTVRFAFRSKYCGIFWGLQ